MDNLKPGFHIVWCDTCQKKSVHYKGRERNAVLTCNHGKTPEVNREAVITVGSLGKGKPEGLNEMELARVNKIDRTLWANSKPYDQRVSENEAKVQVDDELSALLGLENIPALSEKQLAKLYCSFCRKETHESVATRGKGKVTVLHQVEVTCDEDDQPVMSEKTRVQSKDLIACPDCCLKIKPRVDKDGKVHNMIRAPHRI